MFTVLVAATLASQDVKPNCLGNTNEIGACFMVAYERADEELKRYVEAAQNHLTNGHYGIIPSAGTQARIHLQYSQMLWEAHREAECSAIYAKDMEGTIRSITYAACMLNMTNARTHDVWERWLTYPDGSPPVLPEPVPIAAE